MLLVARRAAAGDMAVAIVPRSFTNIPLGGSASRSIHLGTRRPQRRNSGQHQPRFNQSNNRPDPRSGGQGGSTSSMWSIAVRVQRRELPVSHLRQLFAMWADMQSTGQTPNPSALSAVMIAYNQLRCFHVTLQLRKAFHEVDLRPQGHRALLIAASEAADVGAAVDAMKVLEADGVQLGRREYESLLLAALRAEDGETVDAALGALDQLPGRTSGRVHETLLQQCLQKKQYARAAGALRWLISDVRTLLEEEPTAMQQARNRNFALVTRRVLEHTIAVDQEQLACAALGALALSSRGMAQGELLGRLSAAAARGQVHLADALIQQHCAVSLLQERLTHALPVVDTETGGG